MRRRLREQTAPPAPAHRGGYVSVILVFAIVTAEILAAPKQAESASLAAASPIPEPDYPGLISRADLHYDQPVARSEEGVPVGNGRMGSLVWTSPTALKFQINRVDVYPMNSETNSFFERHSDYCCGTGFVDIDLGSAGADVFANPEFSQHLSVYDGLLTVRGRKVSSEVLAWHERDVMAVRVDDRRSSPEPISINLRMLRYASPYSGGELESSIENHIVKIQTRQHTAASQLSIRNNRIILTQEFREGDHYNKSALAIGLSGRDVRPRFANDTELRLAVSAAAGAFTVLIATASSFDPDEDVVAFALEQLGAAERRGFDGLARDNESWWRDFWSRGFIDLESDDGAAEFVEENYTYFLYLMASTSRGKFPPKFNGMLWNTGGDLRAWGSQHWFANLSCYYEALPAANRLELMDPAFEMYSGMYEAAATAARRQWDSQGIYIPETVWFDGLAKLPEEIAREMRELYLLRQPWDQRSARFLEFAATKHPHSSRWNWMGSGNWVEGRWATVERGSGPYGPVTHIFGTTAKIAYLYWRRYEYTLDNAWLRDRAYPMLKGAAEFYRYFPHLQKGEDGDYHIHHVNSNESVWGARDTDEDLSAMRGVFAAAIRASEILNRDAETRPVWREILENLARLPTSDDPQALRPPEYEGPEVWVRGLRPAVRAGSAFLPDPNSLPMWFFDLGHLESHGENLETAQATFDAYFRNGIHPDTPVGVLSKLAIAASSLGRADAVRHLIPNQMRVLWQERGSAYKGGGVLANRMTLREGHQALDAQRLGRASEALHLALLQSNPPGPGEDPIIRVFPAWPKEWNARYRLLARGAFLVGSSIKKGRVEYVPLESQGGAHCRLRNPWPGERITLYRDGRKSEELTGSLLTFATRRGEKILVVPQSLVAAALSD